MAFTPFVFASPPAADMFKFPPGPNPQSIPPPQYNVPFTIPDWLFTAALDAKVPLTIASVYAISAKALNAYNKSTGKKPWAISKTKAFEVFVILHNVFLAIYSAWTWWGMLHALKNSIVSPTGPDGWAATVDSFCRIHGPTGFGNGIFYNEALGKWETTSDQALLTASGEPSRVVPGRLWNEGLAFYGWIFYLSKFYEVLDTLIILAKGKLSSTLQTYHHAGAMLAMWGGIRYMAAPIWIFCFFNSFIHSIMYTYYTATALNIRVPQVIKRSITSLQISQFLVGGSVATIHSIIAYTVPVKVKSEPTGLTETRYKGTHCITTSGSNFATWFNIIYLAPLTYLFVSFFITSYLKRSQKANLSAKSGRGRRLSNVQIAEKAGWDAAKGVKREVYGETFSPIAESPVDGLSDEERKRFVNGHANGHAKMNGNGKKF